MAEPAHLSERRRRRWLPPYPDKEHALWPVGQRTWTRDALIVAWAIGGMTYEIMFGGGSPAVLTALGALMVSPIALHADKRRRDTECPEVEVSDPITKLGGPHD